jgi:exosome complex component RRP41
VRSISAPRSQEQSSDAEGCGAGERRKRGKTDRRSTELSMVIRNTLEQTIMLEVLPRTQIDVYVQVIQADGGTRCACINAAMLALADAGVFLTHTVGGVWCTYRNPRDVLCPSRRHD